MYNPEFWEVQFDQCDLEKFPNEANIWFETEEERERRYLWEDEVCEVTDKIYVRLDECLTERQHDVVLLYFLYQKTQQEIGGILGISRRVVSQHLFGIHRNGRHVGGAVNNLRRMCVRRSITLTRP